MSIIVKCLRGAGDREAPEINNPLIVTDNMAAQRGKRYLDDNYYMQKRRTLKVPHKDNDIIPETWVTVTDSHLGLSYKLLKVKNYRIVITPKSVWATMETIQYVEFTV